MSTAEQDHDHYEDCEDAHQVSDSEIKAIEALRKAELHVHFRGYLTADLFYQMLLPQRKRGYFPASDPLHHFDESFRAYLLGSSHLKAFLAALAQQPDSPHLLQLCRDLWKFNSPDDFFRTYILTGGLARDAEGFYPLADYIVEDLKKQNIAYCELMFSVGEYLNMGWSYSQINQLLEYTVKKAREGGCELYIIFDVVRNIPQDVSLKRLEEILKQNLPYLLGITLGGDEKNFPARNFQKLFCMAQEAGLRRTCHAGEFDDHRSVLDAVQLLGAERIGHGIAAHKDPYTCDLLKERGITLEVCPTSNFYTSAWKGPQDKHPARKLLRMGVPITICADDPGFFQTDLSAELKFCAHRLRFSWREIRTVVEQGFKAGFRTSAEELSSRDGERVL